MKSMLIAAFIIVVLTVGASSAGAQTTELPCPAGTSPTASMAKRDLTNDQVLWPGCIHNAGKIHFVTQDSTISATCTGSACAGGSSFGGLPTCYALPRGNDVTGDGVSPATAKATIQGCLVASNFGGNAATKTIGGMRIVFADQTPATPTPGCGLWLMGPSDPNYGRIQACWLRVAAGSIALDFKGESGTFYGPNAHNPSAQIIAGNGNHDNPGLWLSAVGIPIRFDNTGFGLGDYGGGEYHGINRAIVIGECSDHSRTFKCNSTSIDLGNMSGGIDNNPSFGGVNAGPCLDITGGSYWIFANGMSCVGNILSSIPNNRAAVLIDGATNTGPGLIFIDHCQLAGGGIRLVPGSSGVGLSTNGCTVEGNFTNTVPAGPVELTAGPPSRISIQNLTMADFNGTVPSYVKVSPDHDAAEVLLDSTSGACCGGGASGPMTIQSGAGGLWADQAGFSQPGLVAAPKVWAQYDGTAWAFSSVSPRYPNLTNTDPASWDLTHGCPDCTVTLVNGPAGQINAAGRITSTNASPEVVYLNYFVKDTFRVGDIFAVKTWAATSANGFSGTSYYGVGFSTQGVSCASPAFKTLAQDTRTTGWSLGYTYCTVTAGGDGTYSVAVSVDSTHPLTLYEPTTFKIAQRGQDVHEAIDYITYAQTYPSSAPVGQPSLHVGQRNKASVTTSTISPGLLAPGKCVARTVSVTGATTAMVAVASPVHYPGDGSYWLAYVSAAGTVTVKVCATIAMTPEATAYNVSVN